MKTLYIHIGAHKAGSTAIQNVLQKSVVQLRNQSIFFDPSGYHLSAKLMKVSLLDEAIHKKLRTIFYQKYSIIRENIIVLSGEGFFGDPYSGYNNISAIADNVFHIFQDFDVRIIACVRMQDTFIESLYHQSIKEGDSWSFEEFITSIDIYAYNWYRLLKSYEINFGKENLTVISLERTMNNDNNLIKEFFKALGADLKFDNSCLTAFNPSYNYKGIKIARLCNPILEKNEQRKLRSFLEREFSKTLGTKFQLLPDKLRNDLAEYYSDSNRKLFR